MTIGVGIIGVAPGRSWSAIAHVPALRELPDFLHHVYGGVEIRGSTGPMIAGLN